jgi:hypothetical protein
MPQIADNFLAISYLIEPMKCADHPLGELSIEKDTTVRIEDKASNLFTPTLTPSHTTFTTPHPLTNEPTMFIIVSITNPGKLFTRVGGFERHGCEFDAAMQPLTRDLVR